MCLWRICCVCFFVVGVCACQVCEIVCLWSLCVLFLSVLCVLCMCCVFCVCLGVLCVCGVFFVYGLFVICDV